MDEFVKNAFLKAEADLEMAKGMAGEVMELFDERFEVIMDGWRRNVGEKTANNFCKAIFTFKQEDGLTQLLTNFFVAGWYAHANRDGTSESENDAADRTFNGTPEMLTIFGTAAEKAGDAFAEIATYANENDPRQDAFVTFIQALVHLGFHIGWRERSKQK